MPSLPRQVAKSSQSHTSNPDLSNSPIGQAFRVTGLQASMRSSNPAANAPISIQNNTESSIPTGEHPLSRKNLQSVAYHTATISSNGGQQSIPNLRRDTRECLTAILSYAAKTRADLRAQYENDLQASQQMLEQALGRETDYQAAITLLNNTISELQEELANRLGVQSAQEKVHRGGEQTKECAGSQFDISNDVNELQKMVHQFAEGREALKTAFNNHREEMNLTRCQLLKTLEENERNLTIVKRQRDAAMKEVESLEARIKPSHRIIHDTESNNQSAEQLETIFRYERDCRFLMGNISNLAHIISQLNTENKVLKGERDALIRFTGGNDCEVEDLKQENQALKEESKARELKIKCLEYRARTAEMSLAAVEDNRSDAKMGSKNIDGKENPNRRDSSRRSSFSC